MADCMPIPGFEDYDCSTFGDVWRNGCKLKLHLRRDGYLSVNLSKNGIGHTRTVHSLIALTFMQNPYKKHTVNHIDHNRSNNRLDNLEWATHSEQSIHSPVPIGKSGHRHILQRAGSWKVQIRRHQLVFIKSFSTLEEAIVARDNFLA